MDPHLERMRRLAALGDEAAARELERARTRRSDPLESVVHALLVDEHAQHRREQVRDRMAGLVDSDAELRTLAVADVAALVCPLAGRLAALEFALRDPEVAVRRAVLHALEAQRNELERALACEPGGAAASATAHLLVRSLHDEDEALRNGASRLFVALDLGSARWFGSRRHVRQLLATRHRELGVENIAEVVYGWSGVPSDRQLRRVLRRVRSAGGARRSWSLVECLWILLELATQCFLRQREHLPQIFAALEELSPPAHQAILDHLYPRRGW